jgi:adenosylcobyric acid synthase
LRAHPEVNLQFVGPDAPKPAADLVILPGSKHTRADLAFLQAQGWPDYLRRHLRYGGKLIGICGGYQMLGQQIADPDGHEGQAGSSAGLGLLAVNTTLAASKQLRQVSGQCSFADAPVSGYEIHLGHTDGADCQHPAFVLDDGRTDGAISADGQILGSYLHGLFDHPQASQALLAWAGLHSQQQVDLNALRETSLNRLADACLPLYQRLQQCDSRTR